MGRVVSDERGSAGGGESGEGLVVNHLGQPKVCDQEVRRVRLVPEQQVLRLEVCEARRLVSVVQASHDDTKRLAPVNNAVRVEVCDGTRDRLDKLGCVLLVEVLLLADAVEELATLAEIGHEVHCRRRRKSAGLL